MVTFDAVGNDRNEVHMVLEHEPDDWIGDELNVVSTSNCWRLNVMERLLRAGMVIQRA